MVFKVMENREKPQRSKKFYGACVLTNYVFMCFGAHVLRK